MRSIGKIKIKKLKEIIKEEFDLELKKATFKSSIDHSELDDNIKRRLPEDWFDTWEMAWSEINRVIDDEVWKLIYAK